MIIIWSGWGVLTILFAIAGAGLGGALHEIIPALSDHVAITIGLLAAAALNWWAGIRLNNRPGRELVDPTTGGRVILMRRHTLFWVPMQYYSALLVLIAVMALFASAPAGPGGGKAGIQSGARLMQPV